MERGIHNTEGKVSVEGCIQRGRGREAGPSTARGLVISQERRSPQGGGEWGEDEELTASEQR